MKYIKTYEDVHRPLKEGDYAIISVNISPTLSEIVLYDLLFQIVEVDKKNEPRSGDVKVKKINYDKVFADYIPGWKTGIYTLSGKLVKYWSENKEELETLLMTKKYNI